MSKVANAYKNTEIATSVSSANTQELILLVYDRILENLRLGKKELENNRSGIEEFTTVNELINLGLLASLNDLKGGEIAKNQWYLGEKNHGAVTWEYSQWNWIMCHRDRWIKELKASGQYPN